MDPGRKLTRLALFGRPVKTSLSPRIHQMFAGQFGLDIEYELIDVGVDGFHQALADFRSAGGSGCNVTLPLKREAWQLAVDTTSEVKQAHAANTLVHLTSGGWFAHNTDGIGLVRDLTENHGIKLAGERILILGAGGAAAGILGSLLAHEPGRIVLVNRNLDRARALALRHGGESEVLVGDWTGLEALGDFDLVMNTTSLGHEGEVPPLVPSLFAVGSVCYDLNYHKASLPLKRWCENLGQAYIGGLGMLVEQAAESFSIWTGKKPVTGNVINALEKEASTPVTIKAERTE
jgi:shikimate dehydrogenase